MLNNKERVLLGEGGGARLWSLCLNSESQQTNRADSWVCQMFWALFAVFEYLIFGACIHCCIVYLLPVLSPTREVWMLGWLLCTVDFNLTTGDKPTCSQRFTRDEEGIEKINNCLWQIEARGRNIETFVATLSNRASRESSILFTVRQCVNFTTSQPKNFQQLLWRTYNFNKARKRWSLVDKRMF